MKHLARIACVAASLACLGLGVARGRAPAPSDVGAFDPADPGWARAPLWDDGKAEFSTYVGTTLRYGATRPTEARFIVVKEDIAHVQVVMRENQIGKDRFVERLRRNVSSLGSQAKLLSKVVCECLRVLEFWSFRIISKL